ncbi:glycerate kinase [Cohnella nanjingensis]|uniref:Glycerate kinase n=1 Tax=Cohnella nanjingensis TaxID=1387779 RepID=A0A7X0RSX5_9BACL|nr:glycerate kinase [Cohnella nanjingensis]MBB6673082.1 glycerate kinase [Cohnella nanjingensis]
MRIVLAPDSFKGTLSAAQVCAVMARGIGEELPDAAFDAVPMADGGEGTLDAIVNATAGERAEIVASGPFGSPGPASLGVIRQDGERWAVIEAAALFGLPLLRQEERNPLHTTSRGLGDAIRAALDLGIRRMVVGLGGSATNDGGMGMLSALGARFVNGQGEELRGFGRDLAAVARIDYAQLDPRLADCTLIAATDVANPLLGPQGATRVYGPQKGADPDAVERLEAGMARYADLTERAARVRYAEAPGAGAAGGLGAALLAVGARVEPGARVVGRMCRLEERIRQADLVVTGEGSSDGQTLYGKLPLHVAKTAQAAGKRTFLLSGSLGDRWEDLLHYFAGCLSTITRPAALEDCLPHAERHLHLASRNLGRLIAAGRP